MSTLTILSTTNQTFAAPHVKGYVNVLITQCISFFENLVIGRFSAVNGVAVWTYGAKEPLIEKVEYVNMRPTIAGFGAAAAALPNLAAELKEVTELRDYMRDRLLALGGVVINSPDDALPYVTNISVLGINSEPMLNFLSSRGVYVSSGSACSKGHQSSVLKNMGLSDEVRKSPLRISFSRFTTKEEIDMLIDGIAEGQKTIRKNK